MNFFTKETCDGRYMIGIDCKELYSFCTAGSYNIVGSRVLGLSYPDYLRYLRTNHGATLKGKVGFTYAVWNTEEECKKAVDDLNSHLEPIKKQLIKQLEEK